jgi:hypothetical protein
MLSAEYRRIFEQIYWYMQFRVMRAVFSLWRVDQDEERLSSVMRIASTQRHRVDHWQQCTARHMMFGM